MTKRSTSPQATGMKLPCSKRIHRSCGLAVALAIALPSCSGAVLDLGGADGGKLDACTPTTCPIGQAWDMNTCSCVTPPQTCQPPASCPTGSVFDALLCTCVLKPQPVEAGSHDTGTADVGPSDGSIVSPCGDWTPSCCTLAASGCSLSSVLATGDPCTGWTCGNGTTPTGSCPPACPPDAGTSTCAAGTCRLSATDPGPCLPPGGPIAAPDSGTLSGCCLCGTNGICSSPCICASPDTPIATPTGDRPIASLAVGDVVFSIDHGQRVAVPVRETRRNPVTNHRVVEVVLRGGQTLRISPVHPTADGRRFGDLGAHDWLGGHEVLSASMVPYDYDATYDILPDSDTGTYFAAGALIGSTLAPQASRRAGPAEACVLPATKPL